MALGLRYDEQEARLMLTNPRDTYV